MTTISPLNTTASSGLNLQNLDPSLQLPTATKATGSGSLDQNAFLQLMIQEFKNQDPTSPQDPSQFLSQLAQFSSVTGINNINSAIGQLTDATLANQALQASTIVGHDVLSAGNVETLSANRTFTGAVNLPAASNSGFVQIFDSTGSLVRQIPLGSQNAGLAQFTWDGKNSAGSAMPAGSYIVKAGYGTGQQITAADTYVASRVKSITLGGTGQQTQLTTDDGTQIALTDVKTIL